MDELRSIWEHQGGPLLVFAATVALILWASWRAAAADPHRAYNQGRVSDALELTRKMAREHAEWRIANTAVCMLVAAGRYTEAVAWAHSAAIRAGPFDGPVLLNGAEALYCLGRWDEAEAMLARIDPTDLPPWAVAGLACQNAWIAAHWGRGNEALRFVEGTAAQALPSDYQAEWFFTRAVALWASGDLRGALSDLDRAESRLVRVSSHRNALALRGRVLRVTGDLREAERLLRAAADHPYRWQGGEGLLALALLLNETGRPEEGRRFLERLLSQDPESESATQAATLLGVPPPVPFPPLLPAPQAASASR